MKEVVLSTLLVIVLIIYAWSDWEKHPEEKLLGISFMVVQLTLDVVLYCQIRETLVISTIVFIVCLCLVIANTGFIAFGDLIFWWMKPGPIARTRLVKRSWNMLTENPSDPLHKMATQEKRWHDEKVGTRMAFHDDEDTKEFAQKETEEEWKARHNGSLTGYATHCHAVDQFNAIKKRPPRSMLRWLNRGWVAGFYWYYLVFAKNLSMGLDNRGMWVEWTGWIAASALFTLGNRHKDSGDPVIMQMGLLGLVIWAYAMCGEIDHTAGSMVLRATTAIVSIGCVICYGFSDIETKRVEKEEWLVALRELRNQRIGIKRLKDCLAASGKVSASELEGYNTRRGLKILAAQHSVVVSKLTREEWAEQFGSTKN